jgi:hypothetical protein
MPEQVTESEPIQIQGYSLMHYAIVGVPSKSKKATAKAKKAAINFVQEDRGLEAHMMDSVFSRTGFLDNVAVEYWIVSYVRPSARRDSATQG